MEKNKKSTKIAAIILSIGIILIVIFNIINYGKEPINKTNGNEITTVPDTFNTTPNIISNNTTNQLTNSYLTRQQISEMANNFHISTENSANTSPAQAEINKLNFEIKNLQLQKQQLQGQCSMYAECKFYEGTGKLPDLSLPQTTGNASGEQSLYQILLAEEQVDNQIQYDNQTIIADQNTIDSYKQNQYSNAKIKCTDSKDIAQKDIAFCQSLF